MANGDDEVAEVGELRELEDVLGDVALADGDLHVAGVIASSVMHRENLARAMVTLLALSLAPKPPERLPTLSAVRADGSALALPDGQATVLNLWASWCPPCRREMPVLADAAARHPQIRFVLLNQGEDADVAAAALREMGIPLDLGAWDPDARASDILEARGYPVTLIIDADGRVLRRHLGEVSRASLAAMLGELTE